MRGVKFLADKSGKKTAVILDLRRNAALWEDVYDSALARSRAREPRETLASVRRRLQRNGKLKRCVKPFELPDTARDSNVRSAAVGLTETDKMLRWHNGA